MRYWLLVAGLFALMGCDDGGDDNGAGGAGGEGGAGGGADQGVTPDATPPPACSAETPVCDPGCGGGEACVFGDGECACQPICNGTCNPGCGADEVCIASTCTCEPRGCDADAPVCGPGGNNGCGEGEICNIECACEAEPPPPPANLLRRPSRSSAVDITTDDQRVVMVNADEGSLSVFTVGTAGAEAREARIDTSADDTFPEPLAVVLHPNNTTAYVANRGAGTIARIGGIGSASPTLMGEIEVDGEPVGLALSPTGALLYATDWVAGHVVVIDTATFAVVRRVNVGGNPYAIAVTHDGDDDDSDERVLVTQFYGRRSAEADDTGGQGIVQVFGAEEDRVAREITLAPLAQCFVGGDGTTSGCFPNQLYSLAIHNGRAYVTSVAAGPEGPVNFAHNMQALVSVIDLLDNAEIPGLARNLNSLVAAQQDADGDENTGRRFTNVINGIAFVNNEANIGYVTAGAGDIVVRLEYNADGSVEFGAAQAFNIPVGQYPIGLVTRNGTPGVGDAFVANRVSRDLSVLSFRDQAEARRVESTSRPAEGSPDFDVWKGQRFFFTGTAIWSKEGWGSCAACHPHGLSDNVTWSFPAGPRQTVSLDGQYAPNDPTDMRALNWTAIFDETHDFEINTRTVSGGKGTLNGADGTPINSPMGLFAALTVGGRVENHQALNGSLRAIAADATICGNPSCIDFAQVDAWIQTMPRPRGKRDDEAKIARGRALFDEGGCTKCHSGAKWTISRTFYDPTDFTAGADGARVFAANAAANAMVDAGLLMGLPMGVNVDATQIAGDDSGGGTPPFKRQACNLRKVGTFGAAGGAAEVRQNGQPAQGPNGFNPPSLIGMSLGAPYLHNGAAPTLDALLTGFEEHTQAGNPNFTPNADQRSDLIAFILSIDATTPTFPIPAGSELCPTP
jgi:YVTN family beta-propeller protein